MTETAKTPETKLTYSTGIVGWAGGKPVHGPVWVIAEGEALFPPGRYRISAPTTHPVFGRFAIVGKELSGGPTTPPRVAAGNAITGIRKIWADSPTTSPGRVAAGNVLAGEVIGVLLPAIHRGGFPEANKIVVLSGYGEELMDALELSGGGILEVVA
jgi:hypothetical protein